MEKIEGSSRENDKKRGERKFRRIKDFKKKLISHGEENHYLYIISNQPCQQ